MQAEIDDGGVKPSVRTEPIPYRTVEDLVSLEPTFSQHQVVTGIPFTASYLNLDKTYSALDQDTKGYVQAIDAFLAKRIESGKYMDSAEAVGQLVKEIEGKLRLKDYHDPYYKAERIAKYLDAKKDADVFDMVKPRFTKRALETAKIVKKEVNKVAERIEKAAPQQDKALTKKINQLERAVKPKVEELSSKVDSLLEVTKMAVTQSARAAQRVSEVLEERDRYAQSQDSMRSSLARLLDRY